MAHGITEFDTGCVGFETELGQAWHHRKEYLHFPNEVPFDKAMEAVGYSVAKRRLYMNGEKGFEVVDNAWALINERHGNVLFTSVSDRFEIVQNRTFLEMIRDDILAKHPDALSIESVGSLFGGRVMFANLRFGEDFAIPGDPSRTVNRLLLVNRFEMASPSAGLHSIRVVCDNTRRMAENQSAANDTLRKFMHRKGIADHMSDYAIDLAALYAGVKDEIEEMTVWTEIPVDDIDTDVLLQVVFPDPIGTKDSPVSPATLNTLRIHRESILQDTKGFAEYGKTANSVYALSQQIVNVIDHPRRTRGSDGAALWYDSLCGRRDTIKTRAFATIREQVEHR